MKIASLVSRTVVLVLLASLVVAMQPGEANACSCVEVTTAEIVESADLVFVGQEIARASTNQDWPSVAVTFQAVEAYKGEVAQEITLWTGSGGGDCGVSQLSGLVGVAAYSNSGRPTIDICGSIHSPEAVAAVADPIGLSGQVTPPPAAGDGGTSSWLWVGSLAVAAALAGVFVSRRRNSDWQDGWNPSA